MSRIYDALKEAQRLHRLRLAGERRRSARLVMELPCVVYGHGPDNKPFHEEARTVQVNTNGGLLMLTANIRVGQELLLMNPRTQKEQRCQVVSIGEPQPHGARISVAFDDSSDFWAVAFPKS